MQHMSTICYKGDEMFDTFIAHNDQSQFKVSGITISKHCFQMLLN